MDLYLRKLELSESKYIKIDTIDKEVIIFSNLNRSEYLGGHSLKAVLPLSLIKLLTEINKHIFIEAISVYIYDNKTNTEYKIHRCHAFEDLIEFGEHLLFKQMILRGRNSEHENIWQNLWEGCTRIIPLFTAREWERLYEYIMQVDFPFNPRQHFTIYCGLTEHDTALYWDHEGNRYFDPEQHES